MVIQTETRVRIDLVREEDYSYDIVIEEDLLSKIPTDLKKRNLGNRFALITDSNVSNLYGLYLEELLNTSGLQTTRFVFPAGEKRKKLRTCEDLIDKMSSGGFGRDSVVIALGGGVVGDVAGFVASVFNRGVPYVQIPTTLVSQADSSIGGKTGVDTKFGKNLVGLIKQPKIVYIDPSTLRSLAPAEYFSGLAETVKHGIIQDSDFFSYLEKNYEKVLSMTDDSLLHLTKKNCRIKGNVVEKDPYEKGFRRILNLGHTIGHAIEKLSNYNTLHGYCVSMGIMPSLRIANKITGFPLEDISRVEKLLGYFHLPTSIPFGITNNNIIKTTTVDKKAAKGRARYCLPVKIGEMAEFEGQYATYVDESVVRDALDASRETNI